MNTDRLAKMYDGLTPRERVPLLLAAEKRGDQMERQRLLSTAPPILLQVPDYWPRNQALNMLALEYVTQQLEHIANYWHAIWRLTGTDDEKPEDWLRAVEISAYVFSCNAEAWRQFCAEECVDADQLIAGNYAGWILEYCTERMPTSAPSREAISATLRSMGNAEDPTPVTAESLLARWRGLLQEVTDKE